MASGYPDFEGDKSKVYSAPGWSAVDATEKEFTVLASNKAFGAGGSSDYVVPTGKTLYITDVSVSNRANVAGDGDSNQMVVVALSNVSEFTTPVSLGGNGGAGIALSKPMVITAGQTFRITVTNYANHNTIMRGNASGYEV